MANYIKAQWYTRIPTEYKFVFYIDTTTFNTEKYNIYLYIFIY